MLLLNFTVGIWLGVRQAVRRGAPCDGWLTVLSLAGYAMPSFWLGLVLAWLVGVEWRLLPPAGMRDPLLAPDARRSSPGRSTCSATWSSRRSPCRSSASR